MTLELDVKMKYFLRNPMGSCVGKTSTIVTYRNKIFVFQLCTYRFTGTECVDGNTCVGTGDLTGVKKGTCAGLVQAGGNCAFRSLGTECSKEGITKYYIGGEIHGC